MFDCFAPNVLHYMAKPARLYCPTPHTFTSSLINIFQNLIFDFVSKVRQGLQDLALPCHPHCDVCLEGVAWRGVSPPQSG